MAYSGDEEEGYVDNLDEHSSLGTGGSSQFGSEVDEMSGHSSLLEDAHIVGDEYDINSGGGIPVGTDSSDFASQMSASTSSSATISLPQQQQQQQQQQQPSQHDEVVSSSSSFTSVQFDSSSTSSSDSLSVSSPQNQLLSGERDPDGSNRRESGSAKLMRILYGSDSSSFSDDYDVLVSSSDSSSSSTEESYYDGRNDEGDSPQNEERLDIRSSVSSRLLTSITEEVEEYEEESYYSEDHIENDAIVEGNNSASSIAHSEVLPDQSKPGVDEGKDTPSHDEDAMPVFTASTNLSTDSNTRSSRNSKTSTSNNSQSRNDSRSARSEPLGDQGLASKSIKSSAKSDKSHSSSRSSKKSSATKNSRSILSEPRGDQESTSRVSPIIFEPSAKSDKSHSRSRSSKKSSMKVLTKRGEIDSNTHYGDFYPQGRDHSEVPEHNPLVHLSGVKSSQSANKDEPKQTTIWMESEEVNDDSDGLKGIQKDEIGWKPPALTTFSLSNYEKAPKRYQKEKFPRASDLSFQSKEGYNSTDKGEKEKQRKRKLPKKNLPPPISEVIVRPESDDDSTLGTVGTYLERFPQKKKKKEKPKVNVNVQTLGKPKKKGNAIAEETLEERSFQLEEIVGTEIPDNPQKILGTEIPVNPQEFLQESQNSENDKPDRADPPGDAFRFSYVHKQEQQPLLGSYYNDARANRVDDVEKIWNSSEKSSSVEISTSRSVSPSQFPMASWVVTTITKRPEREVEREVEVDPTRAFINSFLAKRRSTTSAESKTNYPLLDHQQDLENGNGSENFRLQSHDMRPFSFSQSSSQSISEPGEISESSSSQSSYEINVYGSSSTSMNKPSDSKKNNSLGISAPPRGLGRRRGSVSNLNDPGESKSEDSGVSSESKTPKRSAPLRILERSRGSMMRLLKYNKSDDSRPDYESNTPKVSAPLRILERSRGSMMRLLKYKSYDSEPASDSKKSNSLAISAPVRKLGRRGSVSNLNDPGESKSEDSGSESETPQSTGISAPPRRLERARGSILKFSDPGEIQYGSNIEEYKSSGSESEIPSNSDILAPPRRLERARGSILKFSDPRENQYGSNIDDYKSEDSGSESKTPERRLPRRRGSVSKLSTSDESGSSSSLLPTSKLTEDKQVGRRSSFGRNRKTAMLLLLCIALLFIITGIIVVVLWQLGILLSPIDDDPENKPTPFPVAKPPMPSTGSPGGVPTFAPTKKSNTYLSSLIIEAYPEGQSALEDPNSPQSQALKWLESPANDEISETQRLLQRYALATLYYSTNGESWKNSTGWLSAEDECNWMSTAEESICDKSGGYAKIDLQENDLNGTLPAELGILSDTVRSLNTRKNFLSGEIPSSIISNLKDLQVLDLSSNKYSGVLVPELFEARNLTRLSLFENHISSSIPTEIGQLTKLGVLDLGSNKLTSTIPPTINKLSKLAGLSLFDNQLTGTVPIELSAIPTLEMLYIDSNRLEAPVPIELCLLDIDEFWGDCERIQCTCCTMCCADDFGCVYI